MATILALSGSLRKLSANSGLIRAAAYASPYLIIAPPLDSLPYYDQDLESLGLPESVRQLRNIAFSANGFFFATPEYNGFTSGVLKNAIDWLSRPGPEGISPIKGKPFAVVSAGGRGGGMRAQRNISAMCADFDMIHIGSDSPIAVKLFDGVMRYDPNTGDLTDSKILSDITDLVYKLQDAATAAVKV